MNFHDIRIRFLISVFCSDISATDEDEKYFAKHRECVALIAMYMSCNDAFLRISKQEFGFSNGKKICVSCYFTSAYLLDDWPNFYDNCRRFPSTMATGEKVDVNKAPTKIQCRGLAQAVALLHAKGIVHGDLKPDNVLMLPPGHHHKEDTIALIDFGDLSAGPCPLFSQGTMTTVFYSPPETFKQIALMGGWQRDVFSLGIFLVNWFTENGLVTAFKIFCTEENAEENAEDDAVDIGHGRLWKPKFLPALASAIDGLKRNTLTEGELDGRQGVEGECVRIGI